ncbi:hypothetical protein GCM10023196_084260 [Actinoallomurus vinaceus]|uniref:Lipoprotein LpqB beta-propeller domain-containing protein n=1 Tax=Actinoallomurus vinaceus TaxID=1080074 RepID=A0ABP8UN99_9ACTN
MNAIEERLKDSLGAVAETFPAEAVPDLRLPARRLALSRRLVPLIAAGAVAAATAGVAVALPDATPRHRTPQVTAVPPLGQAAIPPRYYLAAVVPDRIAVYETATRRKVARTSIGGVTRLAGTGDGRTFFAMTDQGAHRFYRIRITDKGKVAETTPVPVKVESGSVVAFAASGDGTKLALVLQLGVTNGTPKPDTMRGAVEVADLTTGTTATWRSSAQGLVQSVAMDPTGRTVAFDWQTLGRDHVSQIRALDVTSKNTDLLASRIMVRTATFGAVSGPLAFSPDGRSIAAIGQSEKGGVQIVRYPVTPGPRPRVLLSARPGGAAEFGALAFDPTGTNLLFEGGGYPVSRLANGTVTLLGDRKDADVESAAAW